MKIALVGCGEWGKLILRDLLRLGADVQVVARSERGVKNARDFGASCIVPNISEISNIDGAVVATTIGSHYHVISEILERFPNVNIFCEKPITNSYIEAQDLLSKYPKNIFVMEKWRYHQGVIKLRDLYQSGHYGKLQGIYTCRHSQSNPHLDTDPVWVLLPHDLSIINEIIGYIPEARSAVGQFHNENFESLIGTLGFEPWVQMDISARSTKTERRIELRFEKFMLVLNDGYANSIQVYNWDQALQKIILPAQEIAFANEMPLYAELKAFLDYLSKTGPAPKSSLSEAVAVVKRIEDLRKLATKK
jgi:predicted dehydrogenase